MTEQNLTTKSLVTPDNHALIVCPYCGFSKSISTSQISNQNNLLKIKCKCRRSFKLQLEFRQHFRKETDFDGKFQLDRGGTQAWKVKIINLSMGGVCFKLNGSHSFEVGNKGTLEFTLNDRKNTHIKRRIIIRSTSSHHIKCQFIEEYTFQKELGFYLRP